MISLKDLIILLLEKSDANHFGPILFGLDIEEVPSFKVGTQWGHYEAGIIKKGEELLTDKIEDIQDATWVPRNSFNDLNSLHEELGKLMGNLGRTLVTHDQILEEERLLFGDNNAEVPDDPAPVFDPNKYGSGEIDKS